MTPIYEADVESWVMSLLQEQATPLSPEEQEAGRDGFSDVLLRRRLRARRPGGCKPGGRRRRRHPKRMIDLTEMALGWPGE